MTAQRQVSAPAPGHGSATSAVLAPDSPLCLRRGAPTDLCAESGLAGVASPSLQKTSPLCGQSALSAQRCQVMSAWEATLPLDLPVCFIERRACLPAPVVRKIIEAFSSPQMLCGVAAPYAPR